MHLVRGLVNWQRQNKGCVLTIGNFDGVHLGHQAVIRKLEKNGRLMGLPVVVMLFEPQPLEYFLAEQAPSRLSRLREKLIRLGELPVDYVLLLRFDSTVANMKPEEFIRKILIESLNTKYLVVGDDFRFGYKRRGDFKLLEKLGACSDFEVEDTGTINIDGNRISSTLIRRALEAGNLAQAERFLGRPYSVCGRVTHGQQRGRTLGFPTANVRMLRKNTPIQGVFAITMTGFTKRALPGVANVGTRPTLEATGAVLLEAHLFDSEVNLYDHYVEVHFHEKIRQEQRFDSIEALKEQISKDVNAARVILQHRSVTTTKC